MNHVMCYSLSGKQESQESIKESQNQAKIPKDSRITSIKIQSCGPLVTAIHACSISFYLQYIYVLQKLATAYS